MNVFFQTKSEMPDVLRRILRLTLQTQNQVVNAGAAVLLPAKFDKAVKNVPALTPDNPEVLV